MSKATGICVLAMALLLAARPSHAIVLHEGDGPAETPSDALVARWGDNASAVVIGPNYILTTRHQGGSAGTLIWIAGQQYRVGAVTVPAGLSTVDLRVASIFTLDGKPANLQQFAPLYTSENETGQQFAMGGYGKYRGETLVTSGSGTPYGYWWTGSANDTLRWGANVVSPGVEAVTNGTRTSDCLVLRFDGPNETAAVAGEAAAAEWDSGGGWFIKQGGVWKVAGIIAYTQYASFQQSRFASSTSGQPSPEKNWAIRVSAYHYFISPAVSASLAPNGDANLDGVVDVADLGILGANYGLSERKWLTGDFNGDGIVDVADLGILGANYGADWREGVPLAGALADGQLTGASAPTVPEPATLVLLAGGLLAVLPRRRRA